MSGAKRLIEMFYFEIYVCPKKLRALSENKFIFEEGSLFLIVFQSFADVLIHEEDADK